MFTGQQQFFQPLPPPLAISPYFFPGQYPLYPPPPRWFPPPYTCSAPSPQRFWRPRGGRRGGPSLSRIIRCHTCNREYKSQETYEAHVLSHIKCNQCEFTALPKLVREHAVIHSLPDFLKFTTPEEIQKWRNERKKNYPTMANIIKKKQHETEKKNRRQVLNTPLYKYVNQLIGEGKNYPSSSRGRRSRGHGWRGRSRGSRRRWYPRQPRPQEDDGNHINNDTSIELDDEEHVHSNVRKRSLSSSDQSHPKRKKWLTIKDVFPRKPTLLEKLLAPEIRREHNTLLQCVHHIVSKNFFDKSIDKCYTETPPTTN